MKKFKPNMKTTQTKSRTLRVPKKLSAMMEFFKHLGIILLMLMVSKLSAQELQADTQTCPSDFNSVKIPVDGKLCQIFAADFPASMILFVPQSPQQVLAFYQQESSALPIKTEIKSKYMLQSEDKNTTIIIHADGDGSQVDILVKANALTAS